ncbi:MAG: lysylphosphatidylglycerol synthase transmembrane domain-containing protein [Candidatus Firestonebacteria bacterium]
MKKHVNVIVGLIFGIGFLVLAFYNVQFSDVVSGFKKFNPLYVFPVMALTVVYFFIRAYRWGLIFKPHPVPSFKSLFSGIMIGVMVNNLIPAKIGELSRAFILGKKEKIGVSLTFGTIIVERIFDFLALIFCFFLLFLFSPKEQQYLARMTPAEKTAFISTLSIFIIFVIIIVFFKIKTNVFIKFVEKGTGLISKKLASKIHNWFTSFAEGLKCLNSFQNTMKIFFTSIFQWLLVGFCTWIALISFNINLPLTSACFVMIIVTLGVVIPPSPGGIGTNQLVSVLILNFYGVNGGRAMGFSIVLNFLTFAVGTILGIYFLFKESMNFSELIKFSEEKR